MSTIDDRLQIKTLDSREMTYQCHEQSEKCFSKIRALH